MVVRVVRKQRGVYDFEVSMSKMDEGKRRPCCFDLASCLAKVSGRWAEVDLLGERHWVHRRFHDQIGAADREGGF